MRGNWVNPIAAVFQRSVLSRVIFRYREAELNLYKSLKAVQFSATLYVPFRTQCQIHSNIPFL